MPRSGGRLNLTGALNRNMPPSHLNPLGLEPGSKHASVCRLERELKAVKEENDRLKDQLEDTRSALKEIIAEASHEKFDERRVNMLKLQLIQLQRQVLLMSEALGSRSTALMEVENSLTWLSGKFRHYIGLDVKGAEVPVLRSDLITMVDTSESARIKLFKNIENCSRENLSRPQMFMNPFLKPGMDSEFTLLDTCLGRTDCLNLKHVAQLESKLSRLYKELIKVSETLASDSKVSGNRAAGHISSTLLEHEGTVVLRAAAMARDCAADLLSLSLLFPSAPWPPLKKPTVSEVTFDALVTSLPVLPRAKAAEVQRCVTAALTACNHRCHMMGQEAGALREEVRFHQAVYQMQLDYVLQALDALRDGYREFEQSTNEILIEPMKKLMTAYSVLKNKTSQEGLREFLTVLKQHEQQWADIIQKLDIAYPQNEPGSVALSSFGQEFFSSLDHLLLARQTERDRATSQKEELKRAQQKLEEELRSIIRDGEEQRKTAQELKGKDPSADLHTSRISQTDSLSARPDSNRSESVEAGAWLRPWLDDQNTSKPKKGKKTKGASNTNQKPWINGEDNVEGSGRKPKTETSSGFRPWLDEPDIGADSGGRKADNNAGTGLRPWLDEQYAVGESTDNKKRVTKKRSGEETGFAGASFGTHAPVDILTEHNLMSDVSAHSSARTWKENDALYMQDGFTMDVPPQTQRETDPGALHDQRSLHSYHRNQIHRDNLESPHTNSDHQLAATDLEKNARSATQLDMRFKETPSSHDKPPPSAYSGSNHPPSLPTKGKGRTKPKNYEPKLYVANRTLSLRRSGSLTKLSEPSLEERMMGVSGSRQPSLEEHMMGASGSRQPEVKSSRANSRQSSR